jgi:hypothetical protein
MTDRGGRQRTGTATRDGRRGRAARVHGRTAERRGLQTGASPHGQCCRDTPTLAHAVSGKGMHRQRGRVPACEQRRRDATAYIACAAPATWLRTQRAAAPRGRSPATPNPQNPAIRAQRVLRREHAGGPSCQGRRTFRFLEIGVAMVRGRRHERGLRAARARGIAADARVLSSAPSPKTARPAPCERSSATSSCSWPPGRGAQPARWLRSLQRSRCCARLWRLTPVCCRCVEKCTHTPHACCSALKLGRTSWPGLAMRQASKFFPAAGPDGAPLAAERGV